MTFTGLISYSQNYFTHLDKKYQVFICLYNEWRLDVILISSYNIERWLKSVTSCPQRPRATSHLLWLHVTRWWKFFMVVAPYNTSFTSLRMTSPYSHDLTLTKSFVGLPSVCQSSQNQIVRILALSEHVKSDLRYRRLAQSHSHRRGLLVRGSITEYSCFQKKWKSDKMWCVVHF